MQKAEGKKLKEKKIHIFDYFQVICVKKEAFAAKQEASGINFYFRREKKSDYTILKVIIFIPLAALLWYFVLSGLAKHPPQLNNYTYTETREKRAEKRTFLMRNEAMRE